MSRTTIEDLLGAARRRLNRLDPISAREAIRAGATLVDIRSESQIVRDGTIPGALIVSRNVLEWRLDPASAYRDPLGPDLHEHVIVICDEGYQSSLVAATLQELGFARATDVEGGFQDWCAAKMPVRSADNGCA